MNDHRRVERQVAAMHRVIAERLRSGDPLPLERARANLARWRESFGGQLPFAYVEWVDLIDQGRERVIDVLESGDQDSIRRRASSPFTGVLTAQERWRIIHDAA